ncbi:metal-dependent hydrolase [bacterium]|nr:metal-dependent hydrolase [bacterium]
MDPLTHVLAPVLWTEPLPVPEMEGAAYARWRERAAVLLGALLPDIDGTPALLTTFGFTDEPLFAQYHRIATHSLPGVVVLCLIAAAIARLWPERWLLPSLRTKNAGRPVVRPTWKRLFAFAGIALGFHLLGDAITAWGTLKLLWPFSSMDFQLERVNSIEPVLLSLTVAAWTVQYLFLQKGKRKSAWITAAVWLVACGLYVWLRPVFGPPAYV